MPDLEFDIELEVLGRVVDQIILDFLILAEIHLTKVNIVNLDPLLVDEESIVLNRCGWDIDRPQDLLAFALDIDLASENSRLLWVIFQGHDLPFSRFDHERLRIDLEVIWGNVGHEVHSIGLDPLIFEEDLHKFFGFGLDETQIDKWFEDDHWGWGVGVHWYDKWILAIWHDGQLILKFLLRDIVGLEWHHQFHGNTGSPCLDHAVLTFELRCLGLANTDSPGLLAEISDQNRNLIGIIWLHIFEYDLPWDDL